MRFVGLSQSGWNIYFADVVDVRRLSTTKWEIAYRERQNHWLLSKTIVICDQAWVEVK